MADQEMYIGRTLDGGANVTLDMDHLTTHAVCFGMTGSGKTGLGIVALEELARSGIPLLVIDLKGDMVNLLLNFPELAPGDFAPWIPGDQIGPDGREAVPRATHQFLVRTVDGETIYGSRLGYRITSKFVKVFFGRMFSEPASVFSEDMLRPELQDHDQFIDGIKNLICHFCICVIPRGSTSSSISY